MMILAWPSKKSTPIYWKSKMAAKGAHNTHIKENFFKPFLIWKGYLYCNYLLINILRLFNQIWEKTDQTA